MLPPREAEALGLPDGDPVELQSAPGAFDAAAPAREPSRRPTWPGRSRRSPSPRCSSSSSPRSRPACCCSPSARGGAAPLPTRRRGCAARRSSFRDGQVIFASSTERADRLGAGALAERARPGRGALERCGRLVAGGRPLGQVLVEEGLLDPGQLYGAMGAAGPGDRARRLPRRPTGEFVFVEGRADERNAVRLPERTRDLLLEGMRRREEVERLAGRAPGARRGRRPDRRGAPAIPASRARGCSRPSTGADRPAGARRRLAGHLRGDARPLDGAGPGRLRWRRAAPRRRAPRPRRSAGAGRPIPRRRAVRDLRGASSATSTRSCRRVQPDAGRRLDSYFERLPPGAARRLRRACASAPTATSTWPRCSLNVSDGRRVPGRGGARPRAGGAGVPSSPSRSSR